MSPYPSAPNYVYAKSHFSSVWSMGYEGKLKEFTKVVLCSLKEELSQKGWDPLDLTTILIHTTQGSEEILLLILTKSQRSNISQNFRTGMYVAHVYENLRISRNPQQS